MNIRVATIDDIEQIALLFVEQFDIMADLQPYLCQKGTQDKNFIESIITDMSSQLFVAEENSRIIGFVSVFEKESSDFNFKVRHKYAFIMDIIVTKEYRGKGIATELINEAKQWAAERKFDYIELSVLANNTAVDFYKKNDFEDIVRTMVCKL